MLIRSASLAAALLCSHAAAVCFAQTPEPAVAPSRTPQTTSQTAATPARAAYEEALGYKQKRFAEFENQKLPFDSKLAERTAQEGRTLAARNAARHVAAQGRDLFYLAMLQDLAGETDKALATFDRFLLFAGGDDRGEDAQAARYISAIHFARKRNFEQAEERRREFVRHAAAGGEQEFRLGGALATAYRDARQFDRALATAQEGLQSVLARESQTPAARKERDAAVAQVSGFIGDVLQKQNDKAASERVAADLRALALRLPSAGAYAAIDDIFTSNENGGVKLAAASDDAPTAPELLIAEWIDRRPATLADSRGRVVVLDFWATWCGYCRRTYPTLSRWQTEYGARGLTVIGIAQYEGQVRGRPATRDEESKFVRAFKSEQRMAYTIGVADTEANHTAYGVGSFPTTVLIDRRGRVRHIKVGAGESDLARFETAIKQLLDEPAPAVVSTESNASATEHSGNENRN